MENDDGDLGAVVRASYSGAGSHSALPMVFRATGPYNICELPKMDPDGGSFNKDGNRVGFSSPSNLDGRCNSTQVGNLRSFLSNTDIGVEMQAARMCSDPFYDGNLLSFSSSMFGNLGHVNTVQVQPSRLCSSTVSEKRPRENDQGGGMDYGLENAATEAPTTLKRKEIALCSGSQDNQNLLEKKSRNTSNESGSNAPFKILHYPPSNRADPSANPSGDASCPIKHSIVGSATTDQTASNKIQGIKRRKTQQKRIICIPAAGGSNRPSGEGVPSDLWAWRKYGQKPIKGSPYPRGYYRCSSSKGCSARKQVERSRTDPSMLVITYTADHNHPWPTQRNALAGSIRQSSASLGKNNAGSPDTMELSVKTDHENSCDTQKNHGTVNADSSIVEPSKTTARDAGPPGQEIFHDQEKAEDETGLHIFRSDVLTHNDDFFADLGELPEPLNIFARHFMDEADQSDDETDSTVIDPFNLFNWSSSSFNHVESKTTRRDL